MPRRLEIAEVDRATGVETRVLYYTVPGEDFPALVRRVTFTNLGDTELDLQIVDGPSAASALLGVPLGARRG